MVNTNIIDKAKELITGERQDSYGSFADNITKLCLLMEGMMGRKYSREEARCFFLALKFCRCNKGKFTDDSLTDLIGYAQLVHNDADTEHKKYINPWRVWGGGEQPVDYDVEVMFRDGSTDVGPARHLYWRHDDDNADIVNWRKHVG